MPPPLQNRTSAARPSRSSLLSAVNGEKAIGNRPASFFPVGAVAAGMNRATPSAAAPAPSVRRNSRLSCMFKFPDAVSKLIRDLRQPALCEHHIEQLLAVHDAPVFVFELRDDLMRFHIYHVARGKVSELAINRWRDPVGP